MEFCDTELEARWSEFVCQILPHFEDNEETLGMEWFIFQPETTLIEIYDWFDNEYSEGIKVLRYKQSYFNQYEWFPAVLEAESNIVQLRVIKGSQYEKIRFAHIPELEKLEWVEGYFNTAFAGELTNEPALRKYLLDKICELDVCKLITLWGGEDYDTVVGNDVKGGERTLLTDIRYDFMGKAKAMV